MTRPIEKKKANPEEQHRSVAGLALAFGFLVVVAAAAWWSRPAIPQATSETRERVVDLSSLSMEIRDTDEGRRQGLSGRESLGRDQGMLFVFPESGVYPFWMKDMKFDIDIIWINKGRVVEVVTLPPPGPGDIIPPSHVPKAKADMVLELDAGRAQELGLVPGVSVNLSP